MTSSVFNIYEHVIPCQHIREYPRATIDSQEDVFHLVVKQYTPLDNLKAQPGDVTIIGAHANGFPKELYEPLWLELHTRAKTSGFRIRNIWIADQSHQGDSGVLNENKMGDDPSWFDHSRDLLHMVNHFRAKISRPIVGIAHSMGACQIVNLSLMHPRLFESLILIDPTIQEFGGKNGSNGLAKLSAIRRDIWPSRESAAIAFKKSKFYQTWDPRVLDLWVKHGLRELPTALYPKMPSSIQPKQTPKPSSPVKVKPAVESQPARPVTLKTTKSQEVLTYLRPNYYPDDLDASGQHELTESNLSHKRLTHPDIAPLSTLQSPFYRPEPAIVARLLPHVRPSVLYIFGGQSYLSTPDLRKAKMDTTGTGVGGSGGVAEGRVKEIIMEEVGHMIPMERTIETADLCVDWITAELARWKANEPLHYENWKGVPREERNKLSKIFLDIITGKWGDELAETRKIARGKL